MAGGAGKAALRTALPWLALGGLLLLLVVLIRKELGKGGLMGWLRKVLGLEEAAPISQEIETQQDAAGQDRSSSGVGSAAVTGFFNLESGDTLDMDNSWLTLGQSVDIPVSLVNSSPSKQTVLVQVHVYADYLVSDEEQTWGELVDVGGLSGKQLRAHVNLPSPFPGSRPTLFLDLTVAGVHQHRVERIETSIS